MSVQFGHKVTRSSKVRKLNALVSSEENERRTIETLSKPRFVKGSWDNTQHYTEWKFQRDQSSGLFDLATSIEYLRAEMADVGIPFHLFKDWRQRN